jgi:hypothetical protein
VGSELVLGKTPDILEIEQNVKNALDLSFSDQV